MKHVHHAVHMILFVLVLGVLGSGTSWGQIANPDFRYVASDPSGACPNATPNRYNYTNNKEWGCENSVWTQVNAGGGGGALPAGPATCIQVYVDATHFGCAGSTYSGVIGTDPNPGGVEIFRVGFPTTRTTNTSMAYLNMGVTPTGNTGQTQTTLYVEQDLFGIHNFAAPQGMFAELEVFCTPCSLDNYYGAVGSIDGESNATYVGFGGGVNGFVNIHSGTINGVMSGVEADVELQSGTSALNGTAAGFYTGDPTIDGMITLGASAIITGYWSGVNAGPKKYSFYGDGTALFYIKSPFELTTTGPASKIGALYEVTGNGSDSYIEAAEFDATAGKANQNVIAGYFFALNGGFANTTLEGIHVTAPSLGVQSATIFGINIEDQTGDAMLPAIALNIQDQVALTNAWAIKTGTGKVEFDDLKTTGAATGKKVVCVDTSTGILYASTSGVACAN